MSILSTLKKMGKKPAPAAPKAKKEKKAKKLNILLLTNCDSDNLGDQVIEACDIALITAVMKNLGFAEDSFTINSQKASIVSTKAIANPTPELLLPAEKNIKKCDLVVFGGAPMFNFLYQTFYERTALTLEIAEKYHKPVLFSAIGIEGYSESSPKCQRLKKAVNLDCVKQITTRDDFDSLLKFRDREDIFVQRVSDPAVFTQQVFAPYRSAAPTPRKVGIFILRANGFTDNKVDFSRERSAQLWGDLIKELESRGYDYELLTSGHFGDEAFLDSLIRQHGISAKKCVFNMDTPEQLIQKISSYDGVVSCRLHPSIISFSLKVPSVGVVWNGKVRGFYESTGYTDRTIETDEITPKLVADRLEKAMAEGVEHDPAFLMSVYETLFRGIKAAFCPKSDAVPYTLPELETAIPPYAGTTLEMAAAKRRRKFRRAYSKYNEQSQTLHHLRHGNGKGILLHYYSPNPNGKLECLFDAPRGTDQVFESGAHEYTAPSLLFFGNGSDRLAKNQFRMEGYRFVGWRLRIRFGQCWMWYAQDGSFMTRGPLDAKFQTPKGILPDEALLPQMPLPAVEAIVAEACWEKEEG